MHLVSRHRTQLQSPTLNTPPTPRPRPNAPEPPAPSANASDPAPNPAESPTFSDDNAKKKIPTTPFPPSTPQPIPENIPFPTLTQSA